MNSNFHKAQAEGLIKRFNSLTSDNERNLQECLLDLAKIHAILATVPDVVGEFDQ